jgi:hypothetical protein
MNVPKGTHIPSPSEKMDLLQEDRSYKPDFSGNQTETVKFDDNQLE